MASDPIRNEQEWQLIRELLEREQSQLSVEIHHSRTGSFKHALRDRYDLISNILARTGVKQGGADLNVHGASAPPDRR